MESMKSEAFENPYEIEISKRKERRRRDQNERAFKIVKIISEKGFDDPEALVEFSEWGKTEREIISETENESDYAEEQLMLLLKEAAFFEEAGVNSGQEGLMRQALERLEGTEDAGFCDGALYDAQQKVDAGLVGTEILKDIERKIKQLKENLGV